MALRVPDFFCLMGRIPEKIASVIRILHGIFGALFLVCCLFMPVTANWIWPRYGTPTTIIYLIASMYIAIVLGLVCIRLYKFLSHDDETAQEKSADELVPDDEVLDGEEIPLASPPQTSRHCPRSISCQRRWLLLFLKYAHGLIMVYSWIMLLGAGQAFLENSRTKAFPYPPGPLTDSLVGRCYARNLQSSDMPGWLLNLTCGLGVMCEASS